MSITVPTVLFIYILIEECLLYSLIVAFFPYNIGAIKIEIADNPTHDFMTRSRPKVCFEMEKNEKIILSSKNIFNFQQLLRLMSSNISPGPYLGVGHKNLCIFHHLKENLK